jgi:hypothetical protein
MPPGLSLPVPKVPLQPPMPLSLQTPQVYPPAAAMAPKRRRWKWKLFLAWTVLVFAGGVGAGPYLIGKSCALADVVLSRMGIAVPKYVLEHKPVQANAEAQLVPSAAVPPVSQPSETVATPPVPAAQAPSAAATEQVAAQAAGAASAGQPSLAAEVPKPVAVAQPGPAIAPIAIEPLPAANPVPTPAVEAHKPAVQAGAKAVVAKSPAVKSALPAEASAKAPASAPKAAIAPAKQAPAAPVVAAAAPASAAPVKGTDASPFDEEEAPTVPSARAKGKKGAPAAAAAPKGRVQHDDPFESDSPEPARRAAPAAKKSNDPLDSLISGAVVDKKGKTQKQTSKDIDSMLKEVQKSDPVKKVEAPKQLPPLTHDDILKAMTVVKARSNECAKRLGQKGMVELAITVAKSGSVTDAKAKGASTPLSECVVAATRVAAFPPSAGLHFDYRIDAR